MTILRNDSTPIWQQLVRALRGDIRARSLSPHDRFASEAELSRSFGVSRMTVRRAIAEMTTAGELYTRPGKGTFVAPQTLQAPLGALVGFGDKVRAAGQPLETRVISVRTVKLSGMSATALGSSSDLPALEVKRLRLISRVPVAWQRTFIPRRYYVPLLDADFTESLTEQLRVRCGVTLVRAEESIAAGTAEVGEAQLLHVPAGAPVLRANSVAFTDDATPVRLTESTYRGDTLRFTFVSTATAESEIQINPATFVAQTREEA